MAGVLAPPDGEEDNNNSYSGSQSTILPLLDSEPIVVFSPDYLIKLNSLIEEYLATDEGKIALSNYMVSGTMT